MVSGFMARIINEWSFMKAKNDKPKRVRGNDKTCRICRGTYVDYSFIQ
jgi:hypothetical protein